MDMKSSFSVSSESFDSESGDALKISIPVATIKLSPSPNAVRFNSKFIRRSSHCVTPRRDRNSNASDTIEVPKSLKIKLWFQKICSRKNLERTFPIMKWAPTYNLHCLVSDAIAGVTVALTCLPQALAYATVAGLPPVYGLYSSFVGPFVYIIFGSTKAITIGPAAIQSILTYKYTEGKPPEYAVFLCFVTAVVSTVMGVFRLGFIANFISAPVISAFTSAVALTIIATQLKPLLGLSFPAEEFVESLTGIFERLDDIKREDAILSLVCCSVLIFMKHLQRIFACIGRLSPVIDKVLWLMSVAKSALVMLVSAVVVAKWDANQPFTVVGHISPGLPSFQPPPMEIFNPIDNTTHTFTQILREEASALFVMPLLSVIGHCTIAKVFSGTERVNAAQEILVVGISNAISCFFSSMPIGGSFSRTTVNAQSGVATPAGGLFTGVIIILALQYLTPYISYIPKASLASVICVSSIFMVNPFIVIPLWKSKKMDLIPFLMTFVVTLFAGLEYGIAVGIVISAIFLLFYSARPRVKVGTRQTPKGTIFIHILLDRSLTFPSVDYITNQIIKAASSWGSTDTPVVVDCHHIQYADFTAAEGVRDLIVNLHNMGYKVFFWKVKPSVFRVISGTMRHSDVPFLRCNTEEELDAVVDGVQRRLTMFHPLVKSNGFHGGEECQKKVSESSSKVALSAVATGVFI